MLKTCSLDVPATPCTIYIPAPREPHSRGDVVITTHRRPESVGREGAMALREAGSYYLQIICSDRTLQKTSSPSVPAGFVRRGSEPVSLLSARAGWSVCIQEDDYSGR